MRCISAAFQCRTAVAILMVELIPMPARAGEWLHCSLELLRLNPT